jgi:phospholipase/carboxylesterase
MWSASVAERADRPLLVLLHGHGGREGDLFRLSPYLPLDRTIAAPRGRLEVGDGFSWFDVAAPRPAALDAAADRFAEWLESAGSSASSVTLLGFSQGGVLALQVLRRHPELVDAVVMLSGIVEAEPDAGDAELAELRRPVFWGRGTSDELVPTSGIESTREWLLAHSDLTERIYEEVGHWITDAELDDVNSFLRSHSGG